MSLLGDSMRNHLIVLASALAFCSGTFAQTLESFSVRSGTSVGTLAGVAQAGDGQVLSLYSYSRGNLNVQFTFGSAAGKADLKLRGALKQTTPANVFRFHVRNSAGTWLSLGTVSGASAMKNFEFSVPSQGVVNGKVVARLSAGPSADDSDLDLLILSSASSGPTPTPNPDPTPTPVPGAGMPPGTTWYWQLQGAINLNVNAQAYDIDLFDVPATTYAQLKASGKKVICYFSAGSYENWRSDASRFPAASLGNPLDGWPGERWIDIRNATVREIMAARLDLAKSKGCDGVEPDNVDGYSNNNGLGLTMQDQINYLRYLADAAHARGLTIALKNSTDLVPSLVDKFDFAVVEECFRYNECKAYSPFIAQGKAVLNAEYSAYSSSICTQAKSLGFSTVFFNLALDGSVYRPCP